MSFIQKFIHSYPIVWAQLIILCSASAIWATCSFFKERKHKKDIKILDIQHQIQLQELRHSHAKELQNINNKFPILTGNILLQPYP